MPPAFRALMNCCSSGRVLAQERRTEFFSRSPACWRVSGSVPWRGADGGEERGVAWENRCRRAGGSVCRFDCAVGDASAGVAEQRNTRYQFRLQRSVHRLGVSQQRVQWATGKAGGRSGAGLMPRRICIRIGTRRAIASGSATGRCFSCGLLRRGARSVSKHLIRTSDRARRYAR